ncbi:facilitated trehalose transporter Tret1-like [Belonocnema kinseyi]|uniref:facilitated trehalose transporter Tret1-like n=1 Tax=Belonocnema kinseyi TaxID=2817044 RepID=UPI00143D95E5|nr:facilitated trehalose transporter Tret1-like [Belonocnema kinseyi]
MDPYSFSVEREASKNIEENERECFKDAIVSSRSLNKGFVEPTRIKNAFPEICACIIAASFHIAVGLSMAYSAVIIPVLRGSENSTETNSSLTNENATFQELHASKEQCSWIASIVILCTPLGAFIGSFLMESLGRIRTLQIGVIPCVAGYILIASAQNLPMIFFGRVLAGLATALATSPAIVYITEVARPELRGALMSFGPTLASFGMLLAYLMGAFVSWRLVAWFSIIFAVFPLFLIQIVVPESPVWLVSKGRFEDARKSLEWFYRLEEPGKVAAGLEAQFTTIMKENEIRLSDQRRSKHGGFSTKLRAFLKPTGWKPMFILFMFFLFQQFSGIYITLFYAVNWFDGVQVDAYVASILVGLTRFLCSMVNTVLLRRCKRRVLCIISGFGMAICMSVSGYFKMKIEEGSTEGNWVPVLCLLLYVCTSMIGMLTIPWTMTAELFPTEIRHIAHSISYSMANMLMFGAVQSYFGLIEFLGAPHRLHWFFAGVSLGAAVFVWLLLPETHGKKLSEIEEYFHNNFIAAGSESKERRRRLKRRTQQKAKAAAKEPLNSRAAQPV